MLAHGDSFGSDSLGLGSAFGYPPRRRAKRARSHPFGSIVQLLAVRRFADIAAGHPKAVFSDGTDPDGPLVVVANRLPVNWSNRDGWTRSPGGLVTALDALTRHRRLLWFGHHGADRLAVSPPRWHRGELRAVATDARVAREATNGFANSTLWPALHGMTRRVRWRDEWWQAYRRYNEAFAAAIAPTLTAGACVWVHDYQLLLLPQLLGLRVPGARVGLSIHTPFDAGALGRVPEASALAAGMRAAACIGTQTAGDRDALQEFLALRIGEVRSPTVFTSPVSIDPTTVRGLLHERVTQVLSERERALTAHRTLIVTVDRLDYTKGIMERMRAYDAAFARGWLDPDEVRIVQITQPSRVDVAEYREMRVAVERLAHELHARWPRRDGSSPLEATIESQDRRRVAALLASADACLVTPHRDGMNLVAKEFSVLNEARGGALVITSGAGAAIELGANSVVIDDASPLAIAGGLRDALALPPEERRRMATARAAAVSAWTAADWADAFVDRLAHPGDVTESADGPIGAELSPAG